MHRIDQPAYDWPLSTMKRFAIFLTQEKALEQLDYLFFFNANLTCREVITPEEFLPRPQQGNSCCWSSSRGSGTKSRCFTAMTATPDVRPISRTTAGGICFRRAERRYLRGHSWPCAKSWTAAQSRISANGVVPLWHDESQLNRYAAEHPGSYRLLPLLTGTRKAGRCPLSKKSLCAINPATLMWRRSNTILSTPAAGCNANGKPFAKTTCRICCAQGTNCCKNTCNLIRATPHNSRLTA